MTRSCSRHVWLMVGLWMVVALTGCRTGSPKTAAQTAAQTAVQDSGGPLMREQAAYDVRHYDLSLRVDPARKHIEGTGTVEVGIREPLSWLVLDLDPRLRVSRVRLSDPGVSEGARSTRFEQRGGKLWVFLNAELPAGTRMTVAVDYAGRPRAAVRAPWDGGFTWSKTTNGHPWIATSVQGEGADLWWPCKDHPSDKPESFSLRIRVPKPLVVASNGRLIEVLEHEDATRTYHWHTGFPISNYNVALNIAPYELLTTNYTSVTGESVPATYWVLPENKAKGEKLFSEMLDHLNFYERVLGPYPFRSEKYGVAETPHLGMEHQSIIAYGNQYRGGPHGYDWLHHHELGHEWWGNLVTVVDWRHFWIHEGLCTYMQALYAEEREGAMAYHHALYENRRKIRNERAVVPAQPSGMHVFKDNDPYFKGAWIVHMLRYLIGREQTITLLRRFAYPTAEWETRAQPSRFVSTEDFVRHTEAVTGKKLDWLFNLYLNQPKLPKLVSEIRGDKLILRWETPDGYLFPMPVEVEVNGRVERIAMPGGMAELDAVRYTGAKLDPNLWILKEDRLMEALKLMRN